MSVLRRIRAELAGACRSVRYDLGRRPAAPPACGPDVTSTGMSTFGAYVFDAPEPVRRRPPRRAVAATALGTLTVVGAAGAYLGVVNGLGSLLHETPASADTMPPQPAATSTFSPVTGIGRGPAPRAATVPAAAKGTPPRVRPTTTTAAPRKVNASPIRTTKPAGPVAYPPVPTPTAPQAPTATTTSPPYSDPPTPSDSPSPGTSSANPDDSAEPSESPQARHRRGRTQTH